MKRICWIGLMPLAAIAGCSSNEGSQSSADSTEAPNISSTAAPGVAWRYEYDFLLPDEAISAVQESHASRCESLGLSRCRITGLRYTVSEENAVAAMLQVKLEPSLARQFGKVATTDVTKADGRLSSTEFTGEDTVEQASQAGRTLAESQSRIAEIQRQLQNRPLKDNERAQLQAELQQLRSRSSDAAAAQAGVAQKLAATPMEFNYYGRGGVTGFKGRNPIMDAARSFVASLVTMITVLLQFLAWVLPWALLGAAILMLIRSRAGRAARRFFAPPRGIENETP